MTIYSIYDRCLCMALIPDDFIQIEPYRLESSVYNTTYYQFDIGDVS